MSRKPRSAQLTPLELEIMKVLWQTGAATVQTVQAQLPAERPLAYTTVQTMLNVLHKKGKVKRTLKDRAYRYQATVNRVQAVKQTMGDIIDRLFGGSSESLVLGLVETKQLTPERLAELSKLLSKARTGQSDEDDDER